MRPARRGPEAPVGVFDSGVGGLTVARAIIDQLPDEHIIYVGDTGNGPYGPLSIAEIRAHAMEAVEEVAAETAEAVVAAIAPDMADAEAVKAAVAGAMKA